MNVKFIDFNKKPMKPELPPNAAYVTFDENGYYSISPAYSVEQYKLHSTNDTESGLENLIAMLS